MIQSLQGAISTGAFPWHICIQWVSGLDIRYELSETVTL